MGRLPANGTTSNHRFRQCLDITSKPWHDNITKPTNVTGLSTGKNRYQRFSAALGTGTGHRDWAQEILLFARGKTHRNPLVTVTADVIRSVRRCHPRKDLDERIPRRSRIPPRPRKAWYLTSPPLWLGSGDRRPGRSGASAASERPQGPRQPFVRPRQGETERHQARRAPDAGEPELRPLLRDAARRAGRSGTSRTRATPTATCCPTG